jgi:hypothetical protein
VVDVEGDDDGGREAPDALRLDVPGPEVRLQLARHVLVRVEEVALRLSVRGHGIGEERGGLGDGEPEPELGRVTVVEDGAEGDATTSGTGELGVRDRVGHGREEGDGEAGWPGERPHPGLALRECLLAGRDVSDLQLLLELLNLVLVLRWEWGDLTLYQYRAPP